MSVVSVRLPRYEGKIWTYPKVEFIELFPYCPISLALQDPDADIIDINVPVVTPYVLDYLTLILSRRILPIPVENMSSASKYLLIPILDIVSSEKYPVLLKSYPDINLNDDDTIKSGIHAFAIKYEWPELLNIIHDLISVSWTDEEEKTWISWRALLSAYYDREALYPWTAVQHKVSVNAKLFMEEVPESKNALDLISDMKFPRWYDGYPIVGVVMACLLGKSHGILSRILKKYNDQNSVLYLCTATQLNDPISIDIIRCNFHFYYQGINMAIDLVIDEGKDISLLAHIIGANPPTLANTLIKALREGDHRVVKEILIQYPTLSNVIAPIITLDQLNSIQIIYLHMDHLIALFVEVLKVKRYDLLPTFRCISRDHLYPVIIKNADPNDRDDILNTLGFTQHEIT